MDAEQFHKLFQTEYDALSEKVESLAASSTPERQNAIDDILGRIAQLSNDIKDASSILPLYDQKSYSEKVRKVSGTLADTRASFAPKPKFSFSRKKVGTAAAPASATTTEPATYVIGGPADASKPLSVGSDPSALAPNNEQGASVEPEHENNPTDSSAIPKNNKLPVLPYPLQRGPTHNSVVISSHRAEALVAPSSGLPQACTVQLSSLDGCLVDLSKQGVSSNPFLSLAARDVSGSLLVCGKVDGSAHVTNLNGSVVAVACKQFRLHDSKNTDVYLMCSSRPIIENCKEIRFAHFSDTLSQITTLEAPKGNQWDNVDDFNLPNQDTMSPNWSLLGPQEGIEGDFWKNLVSDEVTRNLQGVLDRCLPKAGETNKN